MKEELKILKLGVTNDDYPYYGQHINFSDKIQSCNEKVYVEFNDNPYPVEGCINFHVLNNVLNNCETPQISQDLNLLKVEDGNFKTSILIDSLDFPQHTQLNIDFVEVDSEFLNLLKTANKYTGDGLLGYIYIDKNYIVSTCNKEKIFYAKHTLDIMNPIGINKKIMSVISEGVEVGTSAHNTVVQFAGGKVIFKIALLDNFPVHEIVNIVENKPPVQKLCNIAILQDAVKKVSSILVNERVKNVYLLNRDKKLEVKAESITNGVSRIEFESEVVDEYDMCISSGFLSGVDLDYNVYVSKNNLLYLTNGKSEIVLVGA
jgi:hypothetical protein